MAIKTVGSPPPRTIPHKPVSNPWHISSDEFPLDGSSEEQLWFAVSYAVLAPSTHNTQPWHFVIRGRDVDILADYSRRLPVIDPQGREMIISCGAALYQLRLALAYFGLSSRLHVFPDSTRPDWLARVSLAGHHDVDAESVILFSAIRERRTNRNPFRPEPLAEELLADLENAALQQGAWLRLLTDERDRTTVARLVAEGDRRQWADKQFRRELAAWVRALDSPHRDGLPITTQDLGKVLTHLGPFVIRTFNLGEGHAATDLEIASHSPVLAILGTDCDNPEAWLGAGQALARVLLRAQADGVSASFLNQPTELDDLRLFLSQAATREGLPQVVLRMGYAEPVLHTRRRAISEVVSVTPT